jgi:hypothetical protein
MRACSASAPRSPSSRWSLAIGIVGSRIYGNHRSLHWVQVLRLWFSATRSQSRAGGPCVEFPTHRRRTAIVDRYIDDRIDDQGRVLSGFRKVARTNLPASVERCPFCVNTSHADSAPSKSYRMTGCPTSGAEHRNSAVASGVPPFSTEFRAW